MNSENKITWKNNAAIVAVFNLFICLLLFIACRIIFLWENGSFFRDLTSVGIIRIFQGGIRFDISALCYINAVYILCMLLPFPFRTNRLYQTVLKWLFLVINSMALVSNLMDTVYFQYINRRSTISVFKEFKDDSLGGIIGIEFINHWYLTLTGILFFFLLWKFYRKVEPVANIRYGKKYYILQTVQLLIGIWFIVGGIRGGLGFTHGRPISSNTAKNYITRPLEANLVMNTPFSIMRTLGKKSFPTYEYFTDREQMMRIYSSIHEPVHPKEKVQDTCNVVILLMESFGREYSGSLNTSCNGVGYMPFLDSLMQESLTYQYSFANGRSSIDGLASVLSGVPMFVESLYSSHAALNLISSIAGELNNMGYYTSFYHGAKRSSLGISSQMRASGFTYTFAMEDYPTIEDYDNRWGIWDEEYLQYFSKELSGQPQPFVSSIFTLTSHHPFQIPDKYQERFKGGELPVHKTIQYADYALQCFFESASKEPWFENTLFIITGDHTNQSSCEAYQTDKGRFEVPVVFYHPTDTTFRGRRKEVAQQIDIMPTVLGYVGYDRPFIAFGRDLLNTGPEDSFAVNYQNGVYQYFKDSFLLQFDGEYTIAFYNFVEDEMLTQNIIGEYPLLQQQMEEHLKAIIQQYMERVNNNELVIVR